MTSCSPEPPIQIDSPKLLDIKIQQIRRNALEAMLQIGSPRADYSLRITNPVWVLNRKPLLESEDYLSLFDGDCACLKVFTEWATIESWNHDGFEHAVSGSSLELL